MANWTTHYTNKERSKIYQLKKKIKNTADPYSVPKSKERKSERQKLIERYIAKLDKTIFCPALDADVMITRKGTSETRSNASYSYKSTLSALNLREIIENATYIKQVPVKRTSKNQKCFRHMHILICPIQNVGYAKLIVGEFYDEEKIPTKYAHYCVTHASLQKIKK